MIFRDDILTLQKERKKIKEELFSTNLKYKSFYLTEMNARLALIKSTMDYDLLMLSYESLRKENDSNPAKRLICKMLSIPCDDIDNFDISGNCDGSTNTIEFTYLPNKTIYAIQFPFVGSYRYATNDLTTFVVDFEDYERTIEDVAFILYKVYKDNYAINYKRIASDVSNTTVLKEAFQKEIEGDKK